MLRSPFFVRFFRISQFCRLDEVEPEFIEFMPSEFFSHRPVGTEITRLTGVI